MMVAKQSKVSFFVICFSMTVIFPAAAVWAQNAEVLESEIDFDNAVLDRGGRVMPAAMMPAKEQKVDPEDFEVGEAVIIRTNRILRRMIGENKKLLSEKKELDERLRNLRGQRSIEMNRMNSIIVERDAYRQQNRNLSGIAGRYENEITELKAELEKKETQLAEKAAAIAQAMMEARADEVNVPEIIEDMMPRDSREPESKSAAISPPESSPAANPPQKTSMNKDFPIGKETVKDTQEKSMEVMAMISRLAEENQKLRADEARVHYNMGNIYYRQGDYRKAVREYGKAVQMAPHDENAHFNLAFVSGEYLGNYNLALEHYERYLQLKPNADDAGLVHEKILEAELYLKSKLNSTLEGDLKKRRGYERNVEVYFQ